jgi:putative sterol carrier protein
MQIDAKEFLFSLPGKVSPDAIEGLQTVFHFDITDSGTYTIALKDGKMEVSEGFAGDPACTVKTTAESFGKLISGNLNPMMAMMTGKLKISNSSEMLKYAKIFGLM